MTLDESIERGYWNGNCLAPALPCPGRDPLGCLNEGLRSSCDGRVVDVELEFNHARIAGDRKRLNRDLAIVSIEELERLHQSGLRLDSNNASAQAAERRD